MRYTIGFAVLRRKTSVPSRDLSKLGVDPSQCQKPVPYLRLLVYPQL
jgi:hypothetical protein